MPGEGEIAVGDAVGHQALFDGRRREYRLMDLIRGCDRPEHVVENIARVPEIGPLVGQDVAPVVVPEKRRVEAGLLVLEDLWVDAETAQLRGAHLVPAGWLLPVPAGVGPAREVHLVPDEALPARARVDGLRRLPVVAVMDICRTLEAFCNVQSSIVNRHGESLCFRYQPNTARNHCDAGKDGKQSRESCRNEGCQRNPEEYSQG